MAPLMTADKIPFSEKKKPRGIEEWLDHWVEIE